MNLLWLANKTILFGLLCAVGTTTLSYPSPSQTPKEEETQHIQEGAAVLRLINTLQLRSQTNAVLRFLTAKELNGSPAFKQMKGAEASGQRATANRLIDRLHLDESEIIPGWRLTLALTPDRLTYIAVLQDVGTKVFLATDQDGRIFQLPSLAESWNSPLPPNASSLPGARALNPNN